MVSSIWSPSPSSHAECGFVLLFLLPLIYTQITQRAGNSLFSSSSPHNPWQGGLRRPSDSALPGNGFVRDDRSAPGQWPLLCEPSVCIFIVAQTGICHLCLWGSSTDTDLHNAPHARTGDLTISYSDQSYCLPHYWLCPSDLGVSQELEAMRLTSWLRLPLPYLLCQISHVWPSTAMPMLCSKFRICRVSPQTTILSNVQNKQNCHNSQENNGW